MQAFSPSGDAFRDGLRKFPSLVDCCTIDWFSAWPSLVCMTLVFDMKCWNGLFLYCSRDRPLIVGLCQDIHASLFVLFCLYCFCQFATYPLPQFCRTLKIALCNKSQAFMSMFTITLDDEYCALGEWIIGAEVSGGAVFARHPCGA